MSRTPGSYQAAVTDDDLEEVIADNDALPREPETTPFRRVTKDSLEKLEQKIADLTRRDQLLEDGSGEEGRLVDGNLIFGEEGMSLDDEPLPEKDSTLDEGNTLPAKFGPVPDDLIGYPLEEIDPFRKEKSFIVISKRGSTKNTVFRFSATKAWFCLPPWNKLRIACIFLATNQFFDYFVMLTILVNCVFLALTTPIEVAEYVFLAIYTLEMLIKLVARGLVANPYTYLRSPWNLLDCGVVISSYVLIALELLNVNSGVGGIAGIRTFRVLRALKTINVIPGLKTIVGALIRSMKMLAEVILLTLFCMMVFSLIGLQVYMGDLRQKCVVDFNATQATLINSSYVDWIHNDTNWYMVDEAYLICGNVSGSQSCPSGYVCLRDVGDNPNSGYTSYDNFGWALLSSYQLITLDFWEDQYNKVVASSGPWNIFFFIIVVFFGSYYLLNLMLAVVFTSYEQEADEGQGAEKEEGKEEAKEEVGEGANRTKSEAFWSYDPMTLKVIKTELYEKQLEATKEEEAKAKEIEDKKKGKPNDSSEKDSKKDMHKHDKDNGIDSVIREEQGSTTSLKSQASSEYNGAEVVVVEDKAGKQLADRNCACCGRCCKCYFPWLKFQNALTFLVTDPFFDLFITLCIVLNTVFMALEHHNMSTDLSNFLEYSNYVFTTIFALEALLKILALSKLYFKNGWNIFDMIIVIVSLVDIPLNDVDGLSVIRTFRLLRVFKLAQSWDTMRLLLSIIMSTLSALGNITLILVIVIYIFAVVGMQLFKDKYNTDTFPEGVPRWNFLNFFNSFMMIFRILCGEWIEPLWDCMRAYGALCALIFFPAQIFGSFMVLNLFLALLLNSFGSDNLKANSSKDDGGTKWGVLKERFIRWCPCCVKLCKKKGDDDKEEVEEIRGSKSDLHKKSKGNGVVSNGKVPTITVNGETKGTGKAGAKNDKEIKDRRKSSGNPPENPLEKSRLDHLTQEETAEDDPNEVADCFPPGCCKKNNRITRIYNGCTDKTRVGHNWVRFRRLMARVVDHKVFEGFIMFLILASSISLCFEDIYLEDPNNATLKEILNAFNWAFAFLFLIEMLLKWMAYGLKKYFSNFWCILDFCIVLISLVSLGTTNISSFRALRTLRALRPLRAISRWQGMKIVVNALVYAIPSIFNVLLVCLVFWLIFSIMGVQLLGGKFYRCIDADGNKLLHTVVNDRAECLANTTFTGYRWVNARIHFDNVWQGYLCLYQIATFEGWMEIMDDAVDARGIDLQPKDQNQVAIYIYFVIFIVFGAFFTLNLLIGVIIDSFNMLKKKYEGSYLDMFLTPMQKSYHNTLKKLGTKKPQKTIKRPKNKIQAFFFDIATSAKFELSITLLIVLNMIALTFEHYRQPDWLTETLKVVNIVFTTIFLLEAFLKIMGLRWHYFRRVWNVFDFIIVVLSIVGIFIEDLISALITPTLLRVIRVFRIGRVLRLIKAAKGIRKLLFALIISLPALLNIGALLFLFMFIYAIIGMTSFGNLKHTGVIDDLVNFETFGNSMSLLFRLSTAAGWNDVIYPMLIDEPDCNKTWRRYPDVKIDTGNCGNRGLAIFYMTSFVFVTFLIIINTYIAIILENFNQAHEQEEIGITDDDFETFYIVWEKYDPMATQFIKLEHLSDLVDELDPPLGIKKPNDLKLVLLEIPIVQTATDTFGDRLHCLDILMAVTKNVLGEVEMTNELKELTSQMEAKFKQIFPDRKKSAVVSNTMLRKKQDVAARTLQRSWRRHRLDMNFANLQKRLAQETLRRKSRAAGTFNNPDNGTHAKPVTTTPSGIALTPKAPGAPGTPRLTAVLRPGTGNRRPQSASTSGARRS